MKCYFIYLMFSRFILFMTLFCSETHEFKIDNSKNLPVLVWWTSLLYPHLEKVTEIKCSSYNCISSAKKRYQNTNTTIAYLFYGTDFNPQNLPLPREKNHLWALLHEESPMNNYIFSHAHGIQLFNYTSTFSQESNYPLTTQFIPSLEYLVDRKPISLKDKNKLRAEGLAPIMYLQSHCYVASDRDRYIEELMKYIKIDSYGTCLHNKDLPNDLLSTETYNDEKLFVFISKYKFHVAFENAICDDYITEKLYRALHVGSIPVYRGSPTVKLWLPSNKSAIIANDFTNPADLAQFILMLDQNDGLYNEYLQFKETGITNAFLKKNIVKRDWGVNDINKIDFIQGFECYLCNMMHTSNKPSVAKKSHMNCPQPHMSIGSEAEYKRSDRWLKEDWIENYWFAYDQAKAIQMILQNHDTNTSNFMNYISKYKYQN